MYRPEGWENPFPQNSGIEAERVRHDYFEEGADAMLSVLKAMGEHYDKDKTHDGFEWHDTNAGTLVWIPDEEVKDESTNKEGS